MSALHKPKPRHFEPGDRVHVAASSYVPQNHYKGADYGDAGDPFNPRNFPAFYATIVSRHVSDKGGLYYVVEDDMGRQWLRWPFDISRAPR